MENFTELFEAFDDLIMAINADWKLYFDLFEKPEHYELFNFAGVYAWVRIRDSLLDSVFLGIARLLDPAASCGRPNLSLERIVASSSAPVSDECRKKILVLKKEFMLSLKQWRNRKLSHNDLAVALGRDILPEVQISHLRSLVEKMNDVCQSLSMELRSVQVDYVPFVKAKRWVPGLIKVLGAGSGLSK